MFKKTLALIALALLAALALSAKAREAIAQSPPEPLHSDVAWQASYWNNTSLSGIPALSRQDANIDFDWGAGAPDGAVASDNFSARWTRYVDFDAGTYTFTATSDDGVRVYIDGTLIIDAWSDHAAQTFEHTRAVTAGHHWIAVEYYERGGQAVARFRWAPAAPVIPADHWYGEYFANATLAGQPALVRGDAAVSFDWGLGSPAPGLPADNFSARWTRSLTLSPGSYRFHVRADDGVRLWVNGHLLVDAWKEQAATNYTGTLYLPEGEVKVKLEYFERGGQAVAQLSWTREGGNPPPPAGDDVIVDDDDAGFVRGGAPGGWREGSPGHDGGLIWTRNNDVARGNYNWARWYPDLAPGRYEVRVWIPYYYTTTGNARYWVSHQDGFTQVSVDQSAHGDQWVSLGTFTFTGGPSDYVSLNDVTGEDHLSRLIAFDAMMFIAR